MAKQALKIIKGSTLSNTFRYESPKKLYRPITNISNTAPMVITAVAHDLPDAWRVKVTNVVGMGEINNQEEYLEATKLTADTIEINSINAVGFKTYVSGGILEYNQPINLTGVSAEMQVRLKVDDTGVLTTLSTQNGGILIDGDNGTLTIYMSAANTSMLDWAKGVYSLELTFPDGTVELFLEGSVSTIKEVVRADDSNAP
jgi:hypothetical protein